MNELETNAPDDIEFMLICNKIDLLNQDDENGDIELSEVIKNAINVAAKKRIPFYTTSAKSGTFFIDCYSISFPSIIYVNGT